MLLEIYLYGGLCISMTKYPNREALRKAHVRAMEEQFYLQVRKWSNLRLNFSQTEGNVAG